MSHPSEPKRTHWSRRDFVRVGAAGLFGLSLADVLRLESHAASPVPFAKNNAENVILIWLGGGPATIDMWDLKADAPEEIRGEFRPVGSSVAGINVCEHLPQVAKVIDKCALVRSLHHSIPAHGPGSQYMLTGNLPSPALEYPSLGSLVANLLPSSSGMPAYFAFNRNRYNGAGYLGASHNPFAVSFAEGRSGRGPVRVESVSLPNGFTVSDLESGVKLRDQIDQRFRTLDDADLPASLNKFQQQSLDILRSDKINKAFNLEDEPQPIRESYGRSTLGQHTLAARRLVQAGARFVTVGSGGWDTHGANFNALRTRLLPPLDQALAALLLDLEKQGMLESTIVYCAGEFGRTPRVNRNAGRDHWARSMSVLIAGGPFKRGYVHGATGRDGMVPASQPCSPDDMAATLFHSLGFGLEHEVRTTSGRPTRMFREAELIHDLLA